LKLSQNNECDHLLQKFTNISSTPSLLTNSSIIFIVFPLLAKTQFFFHSLWSLTKISQIFHQLAMASQEKSIFFIHYAFLIKIHFLIHYGLLIKIHFFPSIMPFQHIELLLKLIARKRSNVIVLGCKYLL